MNDPGPNYRMYNYDQLEDALKHIDKERFPDRVVSIKKYLEECRAKGETSKDKRIQFNENSNTVFAVISIELIFWGVVILLGLFGGVYCVS